MNPDEVQYKSEILRYNEMIDLAELESSKAQERVRELMYEKSRFESEFFRAMQRKGQQ